MNFVDVASTLFYFGGKRLSLENREYLVPILGSMIRARRTVLACGRQVEKTTSIVKFCLYMAATKPWSAAIYVGPRWDQVLAMERARLRPILNESAVFRKILLDGRTQRIKHREFRNGSQLYLCATNESADSVRGLSASDIVLDEFQDLAPDTLAVAEECQSHASDPHTVIAGTSKFADNALERVFDLSTASVLKILCTGCGKDIQANGEIIQREGYLCPHCKRPLDLRSGRWVATNPDSTWGEGYRIPQMLGPWMTHRTILEKKETYDGPIFANEVLGEAVNLGDLVFNIDLLFSLCENRPMARRLADIPRTERPYLVAGVDWGSTSRSWTVLVIGTLTPDYIFRVYYWDRWEPGQEPQDLVREVADRCQQLGVRIIGVDGIGHGTILNPLLMSQFRQRHPVSQIAISYTDGSGSSFNEETPARFQLMIGKSRAVGGLLARAIKRHLLFPRREDSEPYLLEMCTEQCRHDEKTDRVIYEKAPGRPDDALHALVYAVTAAQQSFYKQAVY